MIEFPFRSTEHDNEMDNVLDAIRSDFCDATSPALIRDVSKAFEVLVMQQEALVIVNEILGTLELSDFAKARLLALSSLISSTSEDIQEGLSSIYGTHLDAQGVPRRE